MRDPKMRARGLRALLLGLGLAIGLMGSLTLQAGPPSRGGGGGGHAAGGGARPSGGGGGARGGMAGGGARGGMAGGGARGGMAGGGARGGMAGGGARPGGMSGGGARPGGMSGGGARPGGMSGGAGGRPGGMSAGGAGGRPGGMSAGGAGGRPGGMSAGGAGGRPGGASAGGAGSGARAGSFGGAGGSRGGYAGGGSGGARAGGAGGASGASRPGGGGSFSGHAAPGGSQQFARNGSGVQRRSNGSVSDVHDAGRGVDVHHGLDGSSHSSRSLPGGGQVSASRGGGGYVQHAYFFHGHDFGHRTYFVHGVLFDRFYGHYLYRGLLFDTFVAATFYPFDFYTYVYTPWVAPVVYVGPPVVVVPPVYAYYYAPYPVYVGPSYFLADAVVATSLVAAYDAQQAAVVVGSLTPLPEDPLQQFVDSLFPAAYAQGGATTMTKPVKDQLAAEIQGILKQDEKDARLNATGQDVDPSSGNIVKLFSDGRPHVLLAGASVDVVAASGQECAITAGDVVTLDHVGGDSADGRLLAAKHGGKECPLGATVSIGARDLQDMYNYMRESVEDNLKVLQKKGGTGGLPATPASAGGAVTNATFAKGAPPPEADAAKQIAALNTDAAASEKEVPTSVAADAGGGSGGAPASGGTGTRSAPAAAPAAIPAGAPAAPRAAPPAGAPAAPPAAAPAAPRAAPAAPAAPPAAAAVRQ